MRRRRSIRCAKSAGNGAVLRRGVSSKMKRSGNSHSLSSMIRAPVSEMSAIAQGRGDEVPSIKTLAL